MNRKLGIYYWFGFDIDFKERFQIIKEAGFQATSLWGGVDNKINEKEWNMLPDLARKTGLEVENVHIPFENANFIWESEDNFQIYFGEIKKAIDYCHNHQISTGVLHLTRGFDIPKIENIHLERIKNIVYYAEEKNINVALENLKQYKILDFVFQNIQSERLGFCYDSGHERCWATHENFLDKYNSKLMAVHLHDNTGAGDKHDLPFDGRCNWKNIMNK